MPEELKWAYAFSDTDLFEGDCDAAEEAALEGFQQLDIEDHMAWQETTDPLSIRIIVSQMQPCKPRYDNDYGCEVAGWGVGPNLEFAIKDYTLDKQGDVQVASVKEQTNE